MDNPNAGAANASGVTDAEFKALLTDIIPHLRAYARSMANDRVVADDLVQETLLKAWSARKNYEPRSQFRGWMFTILRNNFLSLVRRRRFVGEWDDLVAERTLSHQASQDKVVELKDVYRALQTLSPSQREAIVLVGAGGISYEEAAEIMGVRIGTVKSRVARARTALEAVLSGESTLARRASSEAGDPTLLLAAEVEEGRARLAIHRPRPVPCPPLAA